jgi:hypothetical protein
MVAGVQDTPTRQRLQLALREALRARDTIAVSHPDQAERLRREASVLMSVIDRSKAP